jgi:hypothetical protein
MKIITKFIYLLFRLLFFYYYLDNLENCETKFIYDLMLDADKFELEELTNKLETLQVETKAPG